MVSIQSALRLPDDRRCLGYYADHPGEIIKMISEVIHRACADAQNNAACLLLVHPEIQMLARAEAVLERLPLPILQIGKELSDFLLDTQRAEQPMAITRWFESRFANPEGCRPASSHLVACSQIDLVFEPCFQLDPLALFKRTSRNHGLIVLWPGEFTHPTLCYAVPEHRHYRAWRIDDPTLQIIRLQD
jgi:hypothetical protein